jgi:hypothetical protein
MSRSSTPPLGPQCRCAGPRQLRHPKVGFLSVVVLGYIAAHGLGATAVSASCARHALYLRFSVVASVCSLIAYLLPHIGTLWL